MIVIPSAVIVIPSAVIVIPSAVLVIPSGARNLALPAEIPRFARDDSFAFAPEDSFARDDIITEQSLALGEVHGAA
ncbi:MAG TPA: hypothetical protein VFJ96_04955, partial [Gemmatimonadaceae bacterium]|nr:hypothetical protein [Gemmatimonadaceae bacterium]